MEYKLPCMTYTYSPHGCCCSTNKYVKPQYFYRIGVFRSVIMEYSLPCMTDFHRMGVAAANNNIHRLPSDACCQHELPGLFVGLFAAALA